MTDATYASLGAAPAAAADAPAVPRFSTRPATRADIDLVHRELMAVIDESSHYNARFKAHEKQRISKGFLRALIAVDPWHVMLLESDGEVGGALISGPDCGAIFRYWSFVFPRFRQTRIGMRGMRAFDAHWDHGRFHKAYTYVRPDNEVALALLRRSDYRQVCVLEKHIFGQDYVVLEKPYTKLQDGYDSGMGMGRIGRLMQRLGALIGR